MEAWKRRKASDRTWQVIDTLTGIAEAHHASPSQVALACLSEQPAVTSVILGARSVDQLRDNMGAAELDLDAAELETLTAVSAPQADPTTPPAGRGRPNGTAILEA